MEINVNIAINHISIENLLVADTIKDNPIGPPIWCIVFVIPLAIPASSVGASWTPADVTGAKISPWPRPILLS